MKILYIDAFSGISGDKMVGALISLTGDKEYLIKELSKLQIKDEFVIEVGNKNVMGIDTLKFDVWLKEGKAHDEHRGLQEIKKIINDSKISIRAKEISIKIFEIIGKAESIVHNVNIEKIHFHEIGAVDSIVDIVSVGILIDKLGVDRVYSSKIALGSGFVQTSHGTLPVPAPATIEILKDVPVYGTEIKTELTTPTGAGIIKYLVDEFIDLPEIKIEKIGYGAGTMDIEIPNILRLYLGDNEIKDEENDFIISLESNFDDCSPEQLAYLSERLFEKGALDVYITPILMKKGRQGQLLSVICNEKDVIILENEIFINSTTFGIRRIKYQRTILKREIREIKVDDIEVKIKLGWYKNKLIHSSIEYESVKDALKKLGISYNEFIKKANLKLLNMKF